MSTPPWMPEQDEDTDDGRLPWKYTLTIGGILIAALALVVILA